ncbi:hypothetical protein [Desulforhabdus sp. TSK]|uniref:hypothetical protein n=1 Tax=Desulforhabdus sp. TSK TaxID=2925014 RepID=UPI001FC7CA43|nr:hypothetical protein [Desulforhabdus sp. TSK]GKT08198.1 hypothetical protein DSTSK_15030 [Desulforhabdus sp. TSK]
MKRIVTVMMLLSFILGGIGIPARAEDAPRPPFPIPEDSGPTYSSPGRCATSMDYDSDKPAPPGELIIVDTLVLRPLGFVALTIGAVGALISMPFAAMTNSCDRVQEALIERPYHYTFTRPLGELDY